MSFEDVDGRASLRYATADLMRKACISCHNTHPQSPKTDWREHDVLGVLEVIIPMEGMAAETRTALVETSGLMGGLCLLGLVGLSQFVMRLRRTSQRATRIADETRQTNRLILDSAGEGIFGLNSSGRFTFVNPAAARMVGWEPDELLDRSVNVIARKTPEAPRFETDTGQSPASGEFQPKGAARIPVEYTSAPIRDEDGNLIGTVVTFRDITLRKQTEDELSRASDAAMQASRMKSEFLANMSHEIRTPMNVIIGMTELVLESDLTRHQERFLEKVRSSADSLLRIINDILDFLRLKQASLSLCGASSYSPSHYSQSKA